MNDHVTCVRCGHQRVRGGDLITPYVCVDCAEVEPDICTILTGRVITAREVNDDVSEHGLWAYQKKRCRCGVCREAKAEYRRQLAQRTERRPYAKRKTAAA